MIINNYGNNANNNYDYFLQKLDISNTSNWNKKYFDATYINSELSYNDSKLFLKFKINIACNSKLPMGIFLINISMPGLDIKNIPIYNTFENPNENINYYPKWICSIYEGNIEIDLTENEYFHREILNENIKINFNFNIDIELFKNSNINYNNDSISMFFYEIRSKNIELNFIYSNTSIISKSGEYFFPIKNIFDSNGKMYVEKARIKFHLPNKFDQNILLNLFSIESDIKNISINGYKIDLAYFINGKYENFIFNQKDNILINNSYEMKIKKEYSFDYSIKNFIEKPNQIGIVFPFETLGNYKIRFTINIFGKLFILYIKNNFNIKNINWIINKIENIEWDDYEKIK